MTRLTRSALLQTVLLFAAVLCPTVARSQSDAIDPKALVERILLVESRQRAEVHTIVFDAEYVESDDPESDAPEKVRFIKKVYIKYLADTAWYHEDYLQYYQDGKLQPEDKLAAEATDRTDKKQKRGSRDISYPMLEPFRPDKADEYEVTYVGIAANPVEGYVCYQFRVESKVDDDRHIQGDFYFDADSFQLVRADFSPAKLTNKLMFRLSELAMSISFAPTGEGFWLPAQVDIRGKGRAAFFFGVDFAGTEYYRNPQVNADLNDSIFGGDHDR